MLPIRTAITKAILVSSLLVLSNVASSQTLSEEDAAAIQRCEENRAGQELPIRATCEELVLKSKTPETKVDVVEEQPK